MVSCTGAWHWLSGASTSSHYCSSDAVLMVPALVLALMAEEGTGAWPVAGMCAQRKASPAPRARLPCLEGIWPLNAVEPNGFLPAMCGLLESWLATYSQASLSVCVACLPNHAAVHHWAASMPSSVRYLAVCVSRL